MNRFLRRFQVAALVLMTLSFVGKEGAVGQGASSSRGKPVSGVAPTRVAHSDTVRSDTVRVPAPTGETETDRHQNMAAQ